MIKFRNKIYEEYFIDPVTALITNKNGVVQKTSIINGRRFWKGNMAVYQIMMHTHKGYMPKMHIHHKDCDKTNDALNNLEYIGGKDHLKKHKPHKWTNAQRESLSKKYTGEGNPTFGKHWKYNEEQLERRKIATRKSNGRRVKCIDTGEVFNSIVEAKEKYGNGKIGDVCKGIRNKACGLRWEYI